MAVEIASHYAAAAYYRILQGAEYNLIECFFPGWNNPTEMIHQLAVDAIRFFVRVAYSKKHRHIFVVSSVACRGKSCCIENESTPSSFDVDVLRYLFAARFSVCMLMVIAHTGSRVPVVIAHTTQLLDLLIGIRCLCLAAGST